MVKEGVYGSRTFASEGVKSYYVSTVPGQVPDAWSGLELSWSRVIRHKMMEEWCKTYMPLGYEQPGTLFAPHSDWQGDWCISALA